MALQKWCDVNYLFFLELNKFNRTKMYYCSTEKNKNQNILCTRTCKNWSAKNLLYMTCISESRLSTLKTIWKTLSYNRLGRRPINFSINPLRLSGATHYEIMSIKILGCFKDGNEIRVFTFRRLPRRRRMHKLELRSRNTCYQLFKQYS